MWRITAAISCSAGSTRVLRAAVSGSAGSALPCTSIYGFDTRVGTRGACSSSSAVGASITAAPA